MTELEHLAVDFVKRREQLILSSIACRAGVTKQQELIELSQKFEAAVKRLITHNGKEERLAPDIRLVGPMGF